MADPTAEDALQSLRSVLYDFGLPLELAERAWAWLTENAVNDPDQLRLWLYDQPEFERRFPAIKERLATGKAPVSPEEYLQLERTYSQIMRTTGLPRDLFNKPDDFTRLIAADVSPKELEDRIVRGYEKVRAADPTVREAFSRFFGVNGDGALAAMFLDPTQASEVLAEKVREAEIGGAALRFGLDLSREQATDLVDAGIDYDRAITGMAQVAELAPLFAETQGEATIGSGPAGWQKVSAGGEKYRVRLDDGTERLFDTAEAAGEFSAAQPKNTSGSWVKRTRNDLTAEEHGVGAVFQLDPQAMDRVRRRLAERKAAFGGGGGAAIGGQGVGLGRAD